ncbi:hypothetical protein [Paucibacter sp. XJ19-41]|uniref:hypothetical protein n=1 Tax=Paucibacter sp. XJ19-41 TaxID=2927824 RepID=UPI002349FDDA|nr:hypothetical protein [Paucibacter sp. XJ19-41]MDC6168048.1 hypothetical protein [Paucibacter sp. XJ19-41]
MLMIQRLALALILALLAACAHQTPPVAETAPQPRACPAGLGAEIRCLGGQDSAGAFYLIAMPGDWNGRLLLHAHGGPFLGAPTMKRVEEDLQRWSIMPRAGYAWAASSFRQGGVAVTAAAEDTERLRGIFVRHMAKPKLTILHGQSWGAGVAARGAELFTAGKPYDAVLLTNGLLAGGTRSYDFRLDLRVVYQYLCNNHPRPDEPQYPLWMGLPAGASLTTAELAQRTRDCLGLGRPAAERSAEQAHRLKTIVDVIRIPERSVQSHLNWATFHFQDIATKRTGGGNVFGNIGAVYRGSSDDQALNAGVLRYAADPAAVARFGADADPRGRIPVPVLTLHGINDPTVFVELESVWADTMASAGRADGLVQTFTADSDHSYLSDASYVAALDALQAWVEQGRKPMPAAVAEACRLAQARFPSSCRFQPDYRPAALESRVPARRRP